jgi:lincosamide nucleotidyltransferase A/C/D/E
MSDQSPKLPFEPKISPALREVLGDVPTRESTTSSPRMDVVEVERILRLSNITGVPLVVDGGWAVDALLGWQTRDHADLDLALNHLHLPKLLDFLSKLGYQHIWRDDQWEHNFVLEDDQEHQVDLHTYITNENSEIVGGVKYPKEALTGKGRIAHMDVTCIEPHHLVAFHSGYPLDANDFQDVRYLCNLFKIELPKEYRDYTYK